MSERFEHFLARLMFLISEQGDWVGAILILRINRPSLTTSQLLRRNLEAAIQAQRAQCYSLYIAFTIGSKTDHERENRPVQ